MTRVASQHNKGKTLNTIDIKLINVVTCNVNIVWCCVEMFDLFNFGHIHTFYYWLKCMLQHIWWKITTSTLHTAGQLYLKRIMILKTAWQSAACEQNLLQNTLCKECYRRFCQWIKLCSKLLSTRGHCRMYSRLCYSALIYLIAGKIVVLLVRNQRFFLKTPIHILF